MSVYQCSDSRGGFSLHTWNYVGVLLQSERWVLVTEPFANDLRWNASTKSDRCMGVPQIVKTYAWQVGEFKW